MNAERDDRPNSARAWTIGEIEDNLNLLQAQAVDYLKEPFECDCFLKHTSIIRRYANENQSFKEHLVRIVRSGIGIFFFFS